MSNRFIEQKRNQLIANVESRMDSASRAMEQFSQSVQDTAANWDGYKATSPNESELIASGLEFAAKARELVDARKVGLARALDIMAAGMIDSLGNTLTRQDLLNELSAVPEAT